MYADSLCMWHRCLLQGVGSHAAHLLLRSGVGKLRLVDFDQVTLSSLNRHAVATRQDVGIPKATCLQRHFQQIMPEVRHQAAWQCLQYLSGCTSCSGCCAAALMLLD
jgi:tRNA A37 threonylcarbamoyladenosine dehydratase